MNERILLVAETDRQARAVLERYESYGDTKGVTALALWPYAARTFRKHRVESHCPDDFLSADDHWLIARFASAAARDWWKYCAETEDEIDGLKVSTLFRGNYDFLLSATAYRCLAISRAMAATRSGAIVIASPPEISPDHVADLLSQHFHLQDFVAPWAVADVIRSTALEQGWTLEVITVDEAPAKPARRKFGGLLEPSQFANLFWALYRGRFDKLRKNLGKLRSNFLTEIDGAREKVLVVTTYDRSFDGVIAAYRKERRLLYFTPRYLGSGERPPTFGPFDPSALDLHCDNLDFSGLIAKTARIACYQTFYLKQHYRALSACLDPTVVRGFITSSIADPLVKTTLWAFHKAGIRTVWHPDGLIQPTAHLWPIYYGVKWSDGPMEKWLLSRYDADNFPTLDSAQGPGRITGYLKRDFRARPNLRDRLARALVRRMLRIPSHDRVSVFATSVASPPAMKMVTEETEFEILQGVADYAAAIGGRASVTGLIKLPLASVKDEAFFRDSCGGGDGPRIVTGIPMEPLIDLAHVMVVYHSSVGLESLFRGTHLIVYNHTGRPNYLTDMARNHLNQDPELGAAVRLARNPGELAEQLDFLLAASPPSGPCPGLEYCLENAAPGYDISRVIRDLDL